MAFDDILLEAEEKMMKTEEVVQHEFANVRTGKASTNLVENILVEVYGAQMRIRELAGITTPEPRMLVIQPWGFSSLLVAGLTRIKPVVIQPTAISKLLFKQSGLPFGRPYSVLKCLLHNNIISSFKLQMQTLLKRRLV